MRIYLLISLLGISTWFSCDQAPKQDVQAEAVDTQAQRSEASIAVDIPPLPYDLTNADQIYTLPKALTEASAVTWLKDNELALIQDERGRIYIFSETEQKVISQHSFASNGDFEGLTVVGDTAYALRSDGTLYRLNNFRDPQPEAEVFRTFLSEEDDTEGLTYDLAGKQLLIACKEPPRLGDKRPKDKRGIYAFSLTSQQLMQQPFALVNMIELKKILQQGPNPRLGSEFEVDKKGSFKPSDLAINPITKEVYVIASKGQLLVVCDRKGKVLSAHPLPRNPFTQPEGICFSPDGTMYISNEGRDGAATLLKFSHQP